MKICFIHLKPLFGTPVLMKNISYCKSKKKIQKKKKSFLPDAREIPAAKPEMRVASMMIEIKPIFFFFFFLNF